MNPEQITERAESLLSVARGKDASGDLHSFVASYEARRDAGDSSGALAYARAIVRRSAFEGLAPATSLGGARTKADLQAEIEFRNEGRPDDELIVPDGRTKAALQAALDADDEAQAGS